MQFCSKALRPSKQTKNICTGIRKSPKNSFALHFKVLLMNESTSNVEALSEIKRMMERSSRFISLSGWSGIAAGICALAGAVIARYLLNDADSFGELKTNLMLLAALVFLASFTLAMFFTYTQYKKDCVPIWG